MLMFLAASVGILPAQADPPLPDRLSPALQEQIRQLGAGERLAAKTDRP